MDKEQFVTALKDCQEKLEALEALGGIVESLKMEIRDIRVEVAEIKNSKSESVDDEDW